MLSQPKYIEVTSFDFSFDEISQVSLRVSITPRNFKTSPVRLYHAILACIEPNYNGNRLHYLEAAGGTGKTFTQNGILAGFRSVQGTVCVDVITPFRDFSSSYYIEVLASCIPFRDFSR